MCMPARIVKQACVSSITTPLVSMVIEFCLCPSDSHRLEYFQSFSLQSIMGDEWVQPESDLWQGKR